MHQKRLQTDLKLKTEEMIDMAGNLNDLINMYQQLRSNPAQFLARRFNIPQNVNLNDPNEITQHLLNTGQVTQEQYNNANNMRNNPIIGIAINGAIIPESVAIYTPQAVEEYGHINTTATVTIPCGCCASVSAVYVDGTEDDAAIVPTPSITVRRNASITIDRIA